MKEITDKKLKIMYGIVCGLMVFTWVMTIVFLIILPETIPLHFDASSAGGYNIYGSKMNIITGPVISTFLGLFVLFFAWLSKKRTDKVREWSSLWCGIIALSFCNVMFAFFFSLSFYM